jgi:hypothetical protein
LGLGVFLRNKADILAVVVGFCDTGNRSGPPKSKDGICFWENDTFLETNKGFLP